MNINQNLKFLRMRKGESQKQTALNTNIPYANYNKYETTDTEPDISTLIKLADYFHTTVDHLIGHDVPYLINKSILTENQLEIFEMIQKLSDSNCNLVKAYLIGLLTAEEEKQNIIKKFTKGE